jgi:hypothetical protein
MLARRRMTAISRRVALLAVLWLGAGSAPAVLADEPAWAPISGPDGAYTAYLPAAPAPFRAVSWTPLGRFVTSGYELERARDGCNLTTTALPAVLRWLGGAEVVYERSRSNFLRENEARATAKKDVLRDGHRGSLLEWANEEQHGRTEFFLYDDRLLIFNCFADLDIPLRLADRFFAHLTLLPPEAPPTPRR